MRLGYLIAPNVNSYVNAGYTGSEWSGATLTDLGGGPFVATTGSFHRDGWFVGGGFENTLNYFGIASPGWFMKTEYRSAFYEPHHASGDRDCIASYHSYLQTLGADHQHVAGLSLQLEWRSREVLISV